MRALHLIGVALLAALALPAAAQRIQTYTHTQSGNNLRPLGYPVPTPVSSLTPVDGFRDYASLHARLQALTMQSPDISAHQVGSTHAGREVWAYALGGAAQDIEGRARPAFFINATTHAREWVAPEVAVGLVERMAADANDGGLVRYLLDNTRLVIIPVQNVDGFLQTQRHPTRVVTGQDPTAPQDWPRDGRMRRKNMPGVDEVLETFVDHLGGVDLNRNHPPFWGSASHGSEYTTPANLLYRGPAVHSEPEVQALLAAAELAPVSRLRLGIDVHSFSRVFYSSNTGRERLNQIQNRLLSVLTRHQAAVPTPDGTPNRRQYPNIQDPPNRGLGMAAEYFAYAWLVPAWTLELEPGSLGGREYGGTADSHGGFVLPASEIRRVRETWAASHLLAFYFMAGPPHLVRVDFHDEDGAPLGSQRWQYDPQTRLRRLEGGGIALPPGQRVRASLVFSKPMRHVVGDSVHPAPGIAIAMMPRVALRRDGQEQVLDSSAGDWLLRQRHWRSDTFTFEFSTPAEEGDYSLAVGATDMAGLALDGDPATPVDWTLGAWTGWENADGVEGDTGGIDALVGLRVATLAAQRPRIVAAPPDLLGEGDAGTVRLSLDEPAAQRLRVLAALPGQTQGQATSVEWAQGEEGERVLSIRAPDNVIVDGDRAWSQELRLLRGAAGESELLERLEFTVLDNDRPDAVVVRAAADLPAALALLESASGATRQLVLDRGDYVAADDDAEGCRAFAFRAPLRVHGNRARLRPGEQSCAVASVSGDGVVELLDLHLDARRGDGGRSRGLLGSAADLRIERSVIAHASGAVLHHAGALTLRRVALLDGEHDSASGEPGLIAVDGRLLIEASSAIDHRASPDGMQFGRLFDLRGATESRFQSVTIARDLMSSKIIGPASIASSWSIPWWPAPAAKASPLPPICRDVRSLGFNVFFQPCFAWHADDVIEQAAYESALQGVDHSQLWPLGPAIDLGGDCGMVDQRGAPRPQSLDPQQPARCDAGAIERGINPYRGIWQPERPGHGVDIQTSGNVLLLAWYTYDEAGEPTAYQAAAPLTGPRWRAELLQSSRDPDSGEIRAPRRVGEVGLDFDDDAHARLSWQFDHRQDGGSERIEAYLFDAAEPRVEVTGLWFPPQESGYGATISRRGELTAVGLYYYDASGALRWMLGVGSAADVDLIEMRSHVGFCPDCDAQTMPVSSQPAGELLFHFLTPRAARLDMELRYPGAAGGVWTRQRAHFVPLGDVVDNRDAAAGMP